MGLFGPKESMEEITNRVRSSECGRLFANAISTFFTEDDTHYHWLMANSKDRMYTLEVFKNGVRLGRVEVSRTRLKETGTYDVDAESWGFGASGYLSVFFPVGKVYAFRFGCFSFPLTIARTSLSNCSCRARAA